MSVTATVCELKKLGNAKFAAKDFAGAEEMYREALSQLVVDKETRKTLLTNIAQAEIMLGKFEAALAHAQSAIELDPSWGKAYHRKAAALHGLGKSSWMEWVYAEGAEACAGNESDVGFFRGEINKIKKRSKWAALCENWYRAVFVLRDGNKVDSLILAFQKEADRQIGLEISNRWWAGWTSRCAFFVGLCFSDASTTVEDPSKRANYLQLACNYLEKSIQLDPTVVPLAFIELELIYSSDLKDLKRARELAKHPNSPWVDPFQRPGFMAPGLRSTPFWTVSELESSANNASASWVPALEGRFEDILQELLDCLKTEPVWSQVGSRHVDDGTVLSSGEWREVPIFGLNEEQTSVAQQTRDLLTSLAPDVVELCKHRGGEVIFSRLGPRTSIAPHCAPSNQRLTAHLGLVIPPEKAGKCMIRVGEGWRRWEIGEVLLFDDSFEHEVVNDTDEERVVLLVRFPHPDLPCKWESRKSNSSLVSSLVEASEKKDELLVRRSIPPLDIEGYEVSMRGVWEGCKKCGGKIKINENKLSLHDWVGECTKCGKCTT